MATAAMAVLCCSQQTSWRVRRRIDNLLIWNCDLRRNCNFADLAFPGNLNALAVDQFIEGSIADIGGISNVSDSFVQYQPRNTWTSRASVSHSHGSHNMKAGVDWRVNLYGGIGHSFTNPRASDLGMAGVAFHQPTDDRSWRVMLDLFDEALGAEVA